MDSDMGVVEWGLLSGAIQELKGIIDGLNKRGHEGNLRWGEGLESGRVARSGMSGAKEG